MAKYVQERLDFTRNHMRRTICDWTPVFLTDESRFSLEFIDKRQLVWRMLEKRFHGLNISEHDLYKKGFVMVWADISVKNWPGPVRDRNVVGTHLNWLDLQQHMV